MVVPVADWVEPSNVTDQLAPLEIPASVKTTAYVPVGKGAPELLKATATAEDAPLTVASPLIEARPWLVAVHA
jgi:hypothetical protein